MSDIIFKVPESPKDYQQKHNHFVYKVANQLNSLEKSKILYDGQIPLSAKPVKLSEYIRLGGYIELNGIYTGFGGEYNYNQLLVKFVQDSATTYFNDCYYLVYDAEPHYTKQDNYNLELCARELFGETEG